MLSQPRSSPRPARSPRRNSWLGQLGALASKLSPRDACLGLTALVTVLVCVISISQGVIKSGNHSSTSKTGRRGVQSSDGPVETLLTQDQGELVGKQEAWAAGVHASDPDASAQLRSLLDPSELKEARELCGRCLLHSLTHSVVVRDHGHMVFVKTGDIADMWIRDSAVQLGIYMPRMVEYPFLRQIVEGGIRMQAFFITQDPWANAFSLEYNAPESRSKLDRKLGRSGWVATRNFEVDSGAYFFHGLYNYWATPGLYRPEVLLEDPLVHGALMAQLSAWRIEQQHGNTSGSYRYLELEAEGLGPPVGYTGMIWGAYRPSDDAQQYGYNIPANLYAASALDRLAELNGLIWKDDTISATASGMAEEIREGVARHGMVEVEGGHKVYAYEVDGLGKALEDFDDPNIPSLLSLPLSTGGAPGSYDAAAYEATRQRILSNKNRFFFERGNVSGLGSPHTPLYNIWPMATMGLAMTSHDAAVQAKLLKQVLDMQCGNGLMHESVFIEDVTKCTRPEFEWANAMYVTMFERLLGESCTQSALRQHMAGVNASEAGGQGGRMNASDPEVQALGDLANAELPHFYGLLQAHLPHHDTAAAQARAHAQAAAAAAAEAGSQHSMAAQAAAEGAKAALQAAEEAASRAKELTVEAEAATVRVREGQQTVQQAAEQATELHKVAQGAASAAKEGQQAAQQAAAAAQQEREEAAAQRLAEQQEAARRADQESARRADQEAAKQQEEERKPPEFNPAAGDGDFASFTVPAVADTSKVYEHWLPPGVADDKVDEVAGALLRDPEEDGGITRAAANAN